MAETVQTRKRLAAQDKDLPDIPIPPAKHRRQLRRRLAPRASQACHACAITKTRCDNNQICGRCLRKKIACIREDFQLSDQEDSGPQHVSIENIASTNHDQTVLELTHALRSTTAAGEQGALSYPETSQSSSHVALSDPYSTAPVNDNTIPHILQSTFTQNTIQDPGDPALVPPIPPTWNFDTSFDLFDLQLDNGLNFGVWGLDAHEVDFLSSLELPRPDGRTLPSQGVHTALASPVASSDGNESTYTVQQAFRQSIGQWTPDSGHYRAHGEENMVSQDLIDLKMDVLGWWDPLISSEALVPRTRDKIVAMAVASCEPSNIGAIVSAFPAVDVLERLINITLTQQKSSVDGYVHLPTFSKAESRVELLAAMVINGSSGSSSRAIQKFGYGLGEILSCVLHSRAEREYSLTRDLQYLQAFCFNLHDALWSGIKNKMELAGSTSGVLVNMLRVGGRFRRTQYPSIALTSTDIGEILDKKWRAWVVQESFKRIVYHIQIHCVQESFINSTAGWQLSPSELSLPLPESRELWLAPSAVHWKEVFLRLQSRDQICPARSPSVIECIGDPSKSLTLPEICDRGFANLAQLYAIASLVCSFKHTQSVLATKDSNLNKVTLIADESQERRLSQIIQALRMSYNSYEYHETAAWNLLSELTSMHLHTSFNQLEILAGREGPDEAQSACPLLYSWFQSEASRHAVWHAGQVLRHMRAIPSHNIHIFYALACYHASLCLCIYGLLSKSCASQALLPAPLSTDMAILLDGEETLSTQRWILLGVGTPMITRNTIDPNIPPRADEMISLNSASALMSVATQIVCRKFQQPSEKKPLLVDNICRLIKSIGNVDRAEPFDSEIARN